MNILFYMTRYPGIGGIEKVTSIIAVALLENHSVAVLSHLHQNSCSVPTGVTLYYMPDSGHWNSVENIQYGNELMSSNNFDVIVYQDSYAPTEKIVCSMASNHRVPLIVFEHNSPLFVKKKRTLEPIISPTGLMRRILYPYLLWKEICRKRYLLSYSSKYILLSRGFIPEFCKLIGEREDNPKVSFIHNPIVHIKTTATRKKNVILCVSRLEKEKRIDLMLNIWHSISSKLVNWKFVIVGDGSERKSLERKIRRRNIPRVELMGYANPLSYYEEAKIFWMTSKFEGWGMTLVEAMQCACVPIVYDTFSSLQDIVDNGINGYIVPDNDFRIFMQRTLELARHEQNRERMALLCVDKSKQFDIVETIKQWTALLNSVVGNRNS